KSRKSAEYGLIHAGLQTSSQLESQNPAAGNPLDSFTSRKTLGPRRLFPIVAATAAGARFCAKEVSSRVISHKYMK
ncbi:MAG: hypothetical protein PHE36_04665, partial [Novosphingobium sp.]|nr:hypothetical protein [Novosphingobium sp.]